MTKPRTSIRQPLLVYASLFMVVLALVVGLISGLSLVNASRRAYRRAARRALIAAAPLDRARAGFSIDMNLDGRPTAEPPVIAELTLAVASSTVGAFGLSLADIRDEAINPDVTRNFVALALDEPGREVYLVGLFDASVPTSIALVEIARMTPFVLLGALGCAGMLVILVGRVLLPPLDALRRAAEETQSRADDGLTTDVLGVPAPNEILDIARRFRQTVRQLNDERDVVETQRDELERMQQNLIRASKLASVGRLAAGIAHEVGNPLAAVQGYLSLLQSGLTEEQATDVLKRSSAELTRIHQTIQKLLTYARTGEERPVTPAPFSVRSALIDAISLARRDPALGHVDIRSTPDEIPEAVGHAGHFHQVMVNLLLNAGHALRDRSEAIIDITVDHDEHTVTVTVRDNGPGIPDSLKEAIFDPFYTTKDPGEGTGLGLAVSRALMEAVSGDLTVADADDGGAAFRIQMPRTTVPR